MVVVLIPVFGCLNLLLVKIEGSDLGCGTWFLLPTISWWESYNCLKSELEALKGGHLISSFYLTFVLLVSNMESQPHALSLPYAAISESPYTKRHASDQHSGQLPYSPVLFHSCFPLPVPLFRRYFEVPQEPTEHHIPLCYQSTLTPLLGTAITSAVSEQAWPPLLMPRS